jgi:hypothetical protein
VVTAGGGGGGGTPSYVLPPATLTQLGGIKGSASLSIAADGTASVPAATATQLGGVKSSSSLAIAADGTATVPAGYAATGTFLQAGANAAPRTIAAKLQETVSAKDFGALGNGAADDAPAIQRAIDHVQSLGGGIVYVPAGKYRLYATLDITKANTVLKGAGGDSYHDYGTTVDGATIFEWWGAAGETVVKVRTPPNLASGSKIVGSGITDVDIKCRILAGIAVLVESVNKVELKRVNVDSPTIAAFKFTTLKKGVDLKEATDTQFGIIESLTWRCLEGASVNAHGIWMTSHGFPSTGNVSLNTFIGCNGQQNANAGNTGVGYYIEDGDNINWIRCGIFRLGTVTPAVEIRGNISTDAHHFYNCTFSDANGIKIRGKASGFLSDPVRCSFYAMDDGNGTQYPSLDTGCRVTYHGDTGVYEKLRARNCYFGSNNSNTVAGDSGNSSLTINNSAANHLVLVNAAGQSWGINISAASGNLRFNRIGSGAGVVETSGSFSLTSGVFRVHAPWTPASATATGEVGTICWDQGYLYVCTAANTWKRAALTTW